MQFSARANTAHITLIHESCPAGFQIVGGLVTGHYVCRCSMEDDNIVNCNTSSGDILLKVRLNSSADVCHQAQKLFYSLGVQHNYYNIITL